MNNFNAQFFTLIVYWSVYVAYQYLLYANNIIQGNYPLSAKIPRLFDPIKAAGFLPAAFLFYYAAAFVL